MISLHLILSIFIHGFVTVVKMFVIR